MKKVNGKIQLLTLLFFASILTFPACKKEISRTNAADEKKFPELFSTSTVASIQVFDDVFNNVIGVNSEIAFGQTGVFGRIITVDSLVNPGYTVTITRLNAPAIFPVQVDIDFGSGYIGKDGMNRKGKIITVYSGPLTVAGKVAETSFDNFYMNDIKVEGSNRVENKTVSQQLVFNITIKDGKLTEPSGNYSIWNSKNTVSQIGGSSTPGYAKDDVLSMIAESNGSIKNGSVFLICNSKTLEPLIKKFTCRWMVKGKVELTGSAGGAALVDFGNGDCDDKASMTINSATTEITLH